MAKQSLNGELATMMRITSRASELARAEGAVRAARADLAEELVEARDEGLLTMTQMAIAANLSRMQIYRLIEWAGGNPDYGRSLFRNYAPYVRRTVDEPANGSS